MIVATICVLGLLFWIAMRLGTIRNRLDGIAQLMGVQCRQLKEIEERIECELISGAIAPIETSVSTIQDAVESIQDTVASVGVRLSAIERHVSSIDTTVSSIEDSSFSSGGEES